VTVAAAPAVDAVQIADRDVDPEVAILAARLDEEDALARVDAQAIRQQAAGGAGAADDVVEARLAHVRSVAGLGRSGGR
jgi:hypothetical protein